MAPPLDRTWYNTLIDDDGSGTTGTIWNRAQVDGLLDTVDASLAGLVDKTGTPAANQLALFSDADTVKGDPKLTADAATGGILIDSASYPYVQLRDGSQAANQRLFRLVNFGGQLGLFAVDDAGGNAVRGVGVARNGDVTVSGLLNLGMTLAGNGGRIYFPPTPNPSVDPSTLDDYREGQGGWQPYLVGTGGQSGQVYSLREGHYLKIGRRCVCYGRIAVSTAGTIAGTLQVAGLPFVSANVSFPGALICSYFYGFSGTSIVTLSGNLAPNNTLVDLVYTSTPTLTASPCPGSIIGNGSDFRFIVDYLTQS